MRPAQNSTRLGSTDCGFSSHLLLSSPRPPSIKVGTLLQERKFWNLDDFQLCCHLARDVGHERSARSRREFPSPSVATRLFTGLRIGVRVFFCNGRTTSTEHGPAPEGPTGVLLPINCRSRVEACVEATRQLSLPISAKSLIVSRGLPKNNLGSVVSSDTS